MKIKVNQSVIPNPRLVKEYFNEILASGILTNNGPFVKSFEEDLKNFTQSSFCYTTSNGTTALELAIQALDLTGEIITTPFSFIASSSSILWKNCTPIFVDIDPVSFCIDPDKIESKISSRTSGILAVHVFGNPCNIEQIELIAKQNKLKTIFDGAHAFGVSYKNKSIFTYGDISTTSFHSFKIVNAGEGGAVFTENKSLSERIFAMRYFGKNSANLPVDFGTNAKMCEINAAMGKVSLQNLSNEILKRKTIAQQYMHVLNQKSSVDVPRFLENEAHNYSYFPIVFNNEESVLKFIKTADSKDIEVRRYFHPSLNELSFMPIKSETPIANSLSRQIVCLPLYSTLKKTDISKIIALIETLE